MFYPDVRFIVNFETESAVRVSVPSIAQMDPNARAARRRIWVADRGLNQLKASSVISEVKIDDEATIINLELFFGLFLISVG